MITTTPIPQSTVSGIGFPATPWTVVLEAAAENDVGAQEALGKLIIIYYEAIAGYFRIKSGPDMAADLAHDFHARLLKSPRLSGYKPHPSIRFRNYLAAALRRFWMDQVSTAQTARRGGGEVHESLDLLIDDPEAAPQAELTDTDAVLDQQTALVFHDRAIGRLKAEYTTPVKKQRFAVLRPLLVFDLDAGAKTRLAQSLGLSPAAFRQALFRLRGDYYNAFRVEVAQTVRREDIDDEMRHLVVLLPNALSMPRASI